MKELMNKIHPLRVIAPISVADNTAQVGQIIDKRGFESLTYVLALGSIADPDATFVVLLEESDDPAMAGAVAVADADLVGTEQLAGFQFDDDNETRKLGYIGAKRYTRLTITPVNNAAAALISAVAILGHPAISPTANPPV
jgi:hypothetical protein